MEKPPIQWVPGVVSSVVKCLGHEAHLYIVPRLKMVELYFHSPLCLPIVVLD